MKDFDKVKFYEEMKGLLDNIPPDPREKLVGQKFTKDGKEYVVLGKSGVSGVLFSETKDSLK